jgi:hypothetical protein
MSREPFAMTAPSGLVPPEWQDQGVWLSLAWQVHGPLDQVGRASAAAKRYAEMCDGETPEMNLMSSGVEISQWRKARHSPHDEVWSAFKEYCINRLAAEKDVDVRLHFGTLYAFGDPQHHGADPVWIPVRAWYGLKRDPDQRDVVRSGDLVYYYVRIVSAEQWQWSLAAKPASDRVPIHPPPSGADPPPIPTRLNARTQDDVNAFMLSLYKDHEGPRPLIRKAAFAACVKGPDGWRGIDEDERWATDDQMRIAVQNVPKGLKNKRGWQSRPPTAVANS